MLGNYNRYSKFMLNGQVYSRVPFVEIPVNATDLFIRYDKSKMRLDSLSYKYFGDPNFGWLILQSNPEYGPYEFLFEDQILLRIPYPFDSAINRYESSANKWINTHNISEME